MLHHRSFVRGLCGESLGIHRSDNIPLYKKLNFRPPPLPQIQTLTEVMPHFHTSKWGFFELREALFGSKQEKTMTTWASETFLSSPKGRIAHRCSDGYRQFEATLPPAPAVVALLLKLSSTWQQDATILEVCWTGDRVPLSLC